MSVFEVSSSLRKCTSFKGVFEDISQAPLSDERPLSFLVYVEGWIAIILQPSNRAIVFDPRGVTDIHPSVNNYLSQTCVQHILFNIQPIPGNPVRVCVDLIKAKSKKISLFGYLREKVAKLNK